MARKFACGPLELTLSGPAGPADFEVTVIPFFISLINEKKENLGP